MADAKAAADVAQSYTTLQGGDLFGVERGGVFGKFTWANFQGQDMSLTGNITVSGNMSLTGALTGNTATLNSCTATIVSVRDSVQHTNDGDNKIVFGPDQQSFKTNNSTRLDLSSSGVRLGGANSRVTTILDEDNMASNSATALATQRSIKTYANSAAGTAADTAVRNTFGTPVNVTGSRSLGTPYTNTTSRPLMCYVTAQQSVRDNDYGLVFTVAGIECGTLVGKRTNETGAKLVVSFLVPTGSTYMVESVFYGENAAQLTSWVES